jgi:ferric-dicitrate binding protein FerR (iron transport regulator)
VLGVNTMKNEDQHMEFREQVVKNLAGEMSPSEQKLFEKNLEADQEKRALFSEFSRIWEGVDRLAARNKYDIDAEWNSLSGKIDFTKPPVKTISFRRHLIRIAAAILIGAVGLAGWYGIRNMSSYDQVALEQGTQRIDLPDGSVVTLYAGSSLKYSHSDN